MAETIRIEVIDATTGGGGAGQSQGTQGGGAPVAAGTPPPPPGSAASSFQFFQQQQRQQDANNASPRRRRNRRDEMPLEGRGWASYLNREMPFGSFAVNQMQWRQEGRLGWARDLLGLPDRLERAIIRAQHKSWGKDPQAFEQLQSIQSSYRWEKWNYAIDNTLTSVADFSRHFFRGFDGIGTETATFGKTAREAAGQLAAFGTLVAGPFVGGAILTFGKLMGATAEIVGHAQGYLSREGNRVIGFSPELRMQGIVSSMREMRTDMEIARQFGATIARQNDQESRRDAAYRLLTTKVATTLTKPFDKVNEAWTTTLEVLSGQRNAMDAVVNAVAAVPFIGKLVKENADKRNADFKNQMNAKEIESGKKLCEDLLNVILPGEIGLNNKAPMRQRPIKNADFGGAGGILPGILR